MIGLPSQDKKINQRGSVFNTAKKIVAVEDLKNLQPACQLVDKSVDVSITKAKSTNIGVHHNLEKSKILLKSIHDLEDKVELIGIPDKTLSALMKLKNDCRVLLDYIAKENAKQTVYDNSELLEFEEQYKIVVGLDTKRQLDAVVNLLFARDLALYRVSCMLLEKQSQDLVSNEKIPPHCSRELNRILVLFYTIKNLGEEIKKIQLTRAEAERAHELIAQQLEVEKLRKRCDHLEHEYKHLKVFHQRTLTEAGHGHALFEKQTKIESLEYMIKSQQLDIDSLKLEKRRIVQEKIILSEEIMMLQTRLDRATQAYQRDITSTKPVLEKQVEDIQANVKNMQELHTDIELRTSRMTMLANITEETKHEMEVANRRVKAIGRELLTEQRRCEKMDVEVQRKERMAMVLVAAKLKQKETADNLQHQLDLANDKCLDLQESLEKLRKDNAKLNDTIYQKDSSIRKLENSEKDLSKTIDELKDVIKGLEANVAKLGEKLLTVDGMYRKQATEVKRAGVENVAKDRASLRRASSVVPNNSISFIRRNSAAILHTSKLAIRPSHTSPDLDHPTIAFKHPTFPNMPDGINKAADTSKAYGTDGSRSNQPHGTSGGASTNSQSQPPLTVSLKNNSNRPSRGGSESPSSASSASSSDSEVASSPPVQLKHSNMLFNASVSAGNSNTSPIRRSKYAADI